MRTRTPLQALRWPALTIATALGLVFPIEARAGVRHSTTVAVRNDTLGLGVFSDTGLRKRLYDSEHPLLRDAYFDTGVVTQLSPANLHPGLYAEIVPVAMLKLRASAQRLQYFGAFGSLSAYPDEDWSPDRLARARRDQAGERTGGFVYDARATLRAKAWRLVTMVEGQVSHYDFELEGPVHEPVTDMLVGTHDEVWQLRSTLGFMALGQVQQPGSLMVAGLYQYLHASDTAVSRHLPGLAAVAKPPAHWWRIGDPAFTLVVGMFAADPYREGRVFVATLLTLTFAEDS